MSSRVLTVVLALLVPACESKPATTEAPPRGASKTEARAPLTDLTTASTLEPVRAAFNGRKGEPRFLTLLAPT